MSRNDRIGRQRFQLQIQQAALEINKQANDFPALKAEFLGQRWQLVKDEAKNGDLESGARLANHLLEECQQRVAEIYIDRLSGHLNDLVRHGDAVIAEGFRARLGMARRLVEIGKYEQAGLLARDVLSLVGKATKLQAHHAWR